MDRDLGVLNDNRECSRKLGESLSVWKIWSVWRMALIISEKGN